MQKLIKIFSEEILLRKQANRFKQLFYIYIFLRCCFWFQQYDLLFGEHALVYSAYKQIGNFKDLAFILLNSHNFYLGYYFLFGVAFLSIVSIYNKNIRIVTDIVIWLGMVNLHYKIYASLTGGDYLINQLLFFNIFLCNVDQLFGKKNTIFNNILHNASVIAIITQVCLLYFLSGLAKLIDINWQNASALNIIAQVDQFKLIPTPHQNILSQILLWVLNYLILIYQLFFPALVFIRKIKKYVLMFGIAMHLYIIVFMGLFWFGSIMILTYIFFWPQQEVDK